MQANKNSNYQVKECDLEFYHVAINQRTQVQGVKEFKDNWRVVKFRSKREFDDFQKNKHVLGLDGEELVHVPGTPQNTPPEPKKGGRPKSNP